MPYHPLARRDSLLILQGLLLLAAIIFAGVAVAQYQLANLTQKKDQIAFFSLSRDDNYRYSVYFLGSGVQFGRLYHLGSAGQRDGRLVCQSANGYRFSIPVHSHFEVNVGEAKSQFKKAGVHFRRLANRAKEHLGGIPPIINQYLPVFKWPQFTNNKEG